jgi:hypothetical protein
MIRVAIHTSFVRWTASFSSVVAIASGFALPTLAQSWSAGHLPSSLYAQSNPLQTETTPAGREEPPLGSQNTESVLDDILILLARDEPPLGSRSAYCAISPGLVGNTDVLWSDRPVFIWQGQATQVSLYNFDTDELLWSKTLEPDTLQVVFDGAALQPGQLYRWELSDGQDITSSYLFQAMDADQRSQLSADLTTLETQLKATGATDETISVERAHYFAERGYWSDALQTLYAIAQPSTEVSQTLQDITIHLCQE